MSDTSVQKISELRDWYGERVRRKLGAAFSSDMSIPVTAARWLIDHVLATRPQRIVEFGAGFSTLVFARAMADLPGTELISLDHDQEWLAWVHKCAKQKNAPMDRIRAMTTHQFLAQANPDPFDFVFVDHGPSYDARIAGIAPIVGMCRRVGCTDMVLDDWHKRGRSGGLYRAPVTKILASVSCSVERIASSSTDGDRRDLARVHITGHDDSVGLEEQAVFIGGTGRCGTTILRQVLAKARGASALGAELHVHIRRGGMLDVIRRKRALSGKEVAGLAMAHPRSDPRGIPALRAGNDVYATHNDGALALRTLLRRAFGRSAVPVEDTPDNMWHAVELAALLPKAKFIHMVRHPLYVLESTQHMHWSRPSYPETAAYLAESYRKCLASERILGDRVLRVRHEDLCDNPQETLAEIAKFTGLDGRPGAGLLKAGAARGRSVSPAAREAMGPLQRYVSALGY